MKDRISNLSSRTRTIENSTMSRINASMEGRGVVVEGKKLQICPCGWQKETTLKGLRIHQGRKKCLVEGVQVFRIDQYFLRSQSSQSVEIQRQVENHSSQNITNPVTEEEGESAGGEVVDGTEASLPVREKSCGQRARVKWPRANERKELETVNRDLIMVLDGL